MSVLAAGLAAAVLAATPEVGPALSGEGVLWGEVSGRGAVRVMHQMPGAEARIVHRVAPASARRTERGFGGVPSVFGASDTTFAALVNTATHRQDSFDSASVFVTDAAVGGPVGGRASVLAGCVPRRGSDGCGDACGGPNAVDVSGDRIAVAGTIGSCEQGEIRSQIAVTGPQGRLVVPLAGDEHTRVVVLAGDLLAWLEDIDKTLVVHDLAAGRERLRLRAASLRATVFQEVALEADGTLAFTFHRRGRSRGVQLGWTAPGSPGIRILDPHTAYGDLALSGGRVLYERLLSEQRFTGELVLRRLTGGPERRLARFPERRRRIGDLDLDATRATWAVRPFRRGYDPQPRGPGRIVVRDL